MTDAEKKAQAEQKEKDRMAAANKSINKADGNRMLQQAALLALVNELQTYNDFFDSTTKAGAVGRGGADTIALRTNAYVLKGGAANQNDVDSGVGVIKAGTGNGFGLSSEGLVFNEDGTRSGDQIAVYKIKDVSNNMAPYQIMKNFQRTLLMRKLGLGDNEMPTDGEVMEFMESVTPLQASAMVPYVTIYKANAKQGISVKTTGYKLNLHNGNFDSQRNSSGRTDYNLPSGNAKKLEEFFHGERESIGGYGIKDIHLTQQTSIQSNFSYNSFKIEMNFIFNSWGEFVNTIYYTDKGEPYNIANLLCGFDREVKEENGSSFTYLVMLELGYTIDSVMIDHLFKNEKFSNGNPMAPKIPAILAAIKVNLAFQLTNWVTVPQDNGRFTLNIKGFGWGESILQRTDLSNIIAPVIALYNKNSDNAGLVKEISEKNKTLNTGVQRGLVPQMTGIKGDIMKTMSYVPGAKDIASGIAKMQGYDGYNTNDVSINYTRFIEEMAGNQAFKFAFIEPDTLFRLGNEVLKAAETSVKAATEVAGKTALGKLAAIGKSIVVGPPKRVTVKQFVSQEDAVENTRAVAQRAQGGAKNISKGNVAGTTMTGIEGTWNELSIKAGISSQEPPVKVPFFFFSELIRAAAKVYFNNLKLSEFQDFEIDFQIDFGEIKILNLLNPVNLLGYPNYININIGDLPISYDYFTIWFNKTIVAPSLNQLLFHEFLQNVANEMISSILNESAFFPWKDTLRLLGLNMDDAENYRISMSSNIELTDRFSRHEVAEKRINKLTVYLYMYSDEDHNNMLSKKMTQKKTSDNANGIWWFSTGADRGMVKKCAFEKVSNPALRSSLAAKSEKMQQNAGNGEFNLQQRMSQMREFYNCLLTLIGSNWLMPGQPICVQPSILDVGNVTDPNNAFLSYIGIGGYYNVISTELKFANGKFETEIKGIWSGIPSNRIPKASGVQRINLNGSTNKSSTIMSTASAAIKKGTGK